MDPFTLVPLFIGVVGTVVVVSILVALVKGVAQWSYNNGQPILTERARVVTKRTDVRSRGSSFHESDDFMRNRTTTDYYVTFELESGERREVEVGGSEYGMLAEGDQGEFTYQGTRYKGFSRRVS